MAHLTMLSSVGYTRAHKYSILVIVSAWARGREGERERGESHWKYVETGANVEYDGDIPVARRLFFGELNLHNSMTCEETMSTRREPFLLSHPLLTQSRGTSRQDPARETWTRSKTQWRLPPGVRSCKTRRPALRPKLFHRRLVRDP